LFRIYPVLQSGAVNRVRWNENLCRSTAERTDFPKSGPVILISPQLGRLYE